MATNFTLTLDTTAPGSPQIIIDSGAAYAATQTVSAGITTADGSTVGYQMKIWGNVDPANDASVQATEGASAWITFAATKSVKLSSGDGVKTLNLKIRDDVWNESGAVTDTITLDTSSPVPNVTVAASPTKISKVSSKDTSTFTWVSDEAFVDYKIKVVSNASDAHTAGTTIATTNGSTNMSATGGSFPAATGIVSTIKGQDLETASAGDGTKIIKVFVKDAGGSWSV